MRRGGAGGEGRLAVPQSWHSLLPGAGDTSCLSVPLCCPCPPELALNPPQPVLPNAPLPLQGLCHGLGKNQFTDE